LWLIVYGGVVLGFNAIMIVMVRESIHWIALQLQNIFIFKLDDYKVFLLFESGPWSGFWRMYELHQAAHRTLSIGLVHLSKWNDIIKDVLCIAMYRLGQRMVIRSQILSSIWWL
jgi:hypothetical protein